MDDTNPAAPPRPGGEPVALTREFALATREAVRYVMGSRRGGAPLPRRQGGPAANAMIKARTGASGIGPGSADGSAPGSGAVTLADWDGLNSRWVAGGDTVTALNPGPTAVAANVFVTLGWVGGKWEVVVEPCPG